MQPRELEAVQSRARAGLRLLSLWSRHVELVERAEHYLERVALADKRDTLVGFFAIDEKPTGSKDPYALRRAALMTLPRDASLEEAILGGGLAGLTAKL